VPQDGRDIYATEEAEGVAPKVLYGKDSTPEEKDTPKYKEASEARDVDIAFQGLVSLLDVFCDYIGYFDVIAWTFTLPGISEGNYDGYVEFVAWTYTLPGVFVEE
jgi:hypothetical protein